MTFITYISGLLVRRPCSGMAALLRHINCPNYYLLLLMTITFGLFGVVRYSSAAEAMGQLGHLVQS